MCIGTSRNVVASDKIRITSIINYNNWVRGHEGTRSEFGPEDQLRNTDGNEIKKTKQKRNFNRSGRTGATRGCVVYCVPCTIVCVPSDLPLSRFTATGRLASGEPRGPLQLLLRGRACVGMGRTGNGRIRGARRRNRRRRVIHRPRAAAEYSTSKSFDNTLYYGRGRPYRIF